MSASDSLARLKTDTLGDQVHTALRNAVLEGRLRAGERVTERDVAKRLDVSPTPVREALRQLVHERVFERTGPRSVRVAEHGSTTLAEVAELEAHGARTPGFSTEAVHTPARVNVRCVTPLGEEVASIW